VIVQMVTTGKIARRSARAATGRKDQQQSGMTTECKTAGETRRRTTGTEAWRRTGKHGEDPRRAELRQCSVGRCDGGAEQHARGQSKKSLADIVCFLRSRAVAE
jgi:hypothetical protein